MINNYEKLSNAIILQAVKDYRSALRMLEAHPNKKAAVYEIRNIEQFFRSQYFSVLTSIDPENLIDRLKAERKG